MTAAGPFDPRRSTLGETLVHLGVIDAEQLAHALRECKGDQKSLSKSLVALGYTTEEKILKAVSLRLGIPYFTSFEGMLDPDAARLVPEIVARRLLAVPIYSSDDALTVGMVNPIDLEAIAELEQKSGLRVIPVMTTLANLFSAVQESYGGEAPSAKPAPGSAAPPRHQERSIVDSVTLLLQEAMSRNASDIHLEPGETGLRVRYRVDGMLQEARGHDKEAETAVIARIKILSKLDITESRLPQDGHLSFPYGDRKIDVRVSTLPTIYGEKVVMRILDSTKALKRLGQLGLSEGNLKAFSAAIRRPNGIVLVTGPTGSGKTTTLYGALTELNAPERNIVTLEDPVEYRIAGINQVATHAKIGMTFAAGLRAILRQDPNIVLVGEIRDLETAEIAMQAALTGHLVFATLHTNDAVSAIHRLLNMRVEPFLISAALAGVMAQRLVRRLCPRCKAPHRPTAQEREALGAALPAGASFFDAPGCDACAKTGYSGRFAIHEWFAGDRAARELILRRASADELREAGLKAGMATLQADALQRAAAGETSLGEVVRVTRESEE
ncbi:MAG: Flp pilus assembly complex ATPase component TadA [Elusimicrobia bacterium]|nr:Flp pilus assembly complex ATPase component TadA [Elusimicrobiota bacterium]